MQHFVTISDVAIVRSLENNIFAVSMPISALVISIQMSTLLIIHNSHYNTCGQRHNTFRSIGASVIVGLCCDRMYLLTEALDACMRFCKKGICRSVGPQFTLIYVGRKVWLTVCGSKVADN